MQRDADRITKLFTRTIRRTVADFVEARDDELPPRCDSGDAGDPVSPVSHP